jgi:hypothetical protein
MACPGKLDVASTTPEGDEPRTASTFLVDGGSSGAYVTPL